MEIENRTDDSLLSSEKVENPEKSQKSLSNFEKDCSRSCPLRIMVASQQVVSPAKTGVQWFHNDLILLDSGFLRNDDQYPLPVFYDIIKHGFLLKSNFHAKEHFPYGSIPVLTGRALSADHSTQDPR